MNIYKFSNIYNNLFKKFLKKIELQIKKGKELTIMKKVKTE